MSLFTTDPYSPDKGDFLSCRSNSIGRDGDKSYFQKADNIETNVNCVFNKYAKNEILCDFRE